jgi:hypothetical protein
MISRISMCPSPSFRSRGYRLQHEFVPDHDAAPRQADALF